MAQSRICLPAGDGGEFGRVIAFARGDKNCAKDGGLAARDMGLVSGFQGEGSMGGVWGGEWMVALLVFRK